MKKKGSEQTGKDVMAAGWALVLLLMVLLPGCAQLPEYARPHFSMAEDADTVNREGFTYRALAVADFKAVSLPDEVKQHDEHINARSCISIRPSSDSTGQIAEAVYAGQTVFIGTIDHVVFEAIFVPECSWWNHGMDPGREDYVLIHEQIHFGLAELAARDLNRSTREAFTNSLVIDNSYQPVKEELADQLHTLAKRAMEKSLEEHIRFDDETSLYYDPVAQQRWLKEVNERLGHKVK